MLLMFRKCRHAIKKKQFYRSFQTVRSRIGWMILSLSSQLVQPWVCFGVYWRLTLGPHGSVKYIYIYIYSREFLISFMNLENYHICLVGKVNKKKYPLSLIYTLRYDPCLHKGVMRHDLEHFGGFCSVSVPQGTW